MWRPGPPRPASRSRGPRRPTPPERPATVRGSGLGPLPDDLPRILLELDALVGRLPHEPVARPARELGADHELRPQPVGRARRGSWRGRREGLLVRGQGRDRGEELGASGVREPGADLARVAELAD